VSPSDPERVTLGDCYGHGVLRSENGGATWEERNGGLASQETDRRVRSLVQHPTLPDVLFIGTADSVFKTVDGGRNWTASGVGLPGKAVYRLALDPSDPLHLLAGLDGGENPGNQLQPAES